MDELSPHRTDVALADLHVNVAALRSFIEVVDRGSVTASARALHLSQSAVSTHVSGLARLAGGALFERRDGQLELTELGRVVSESGREVVGSVEAFRQRLSRHIRESRDALSLASSRAASEATLATTISGFEAVAPGARLAVEIEPTSTVVRHLETDAVDIALVEGSFEVPGCRFAQYATAKARLAMAPDHPLVHAERPLTFDALLEARLIVQSRASSTRRFVEAAIGERFNRLRITLELESSEAILACIEAGLGVGFVSEAAASRSVSLGTLVTVGLDGVDLTRTFSVGYRVEGRLRPVVQRFVHWLVPSAAIPASPPRPRP